MISRRCGRGEAEDPAHRAAVDAVVDDAAVGPQVAPGRGRAGTVHPGHLATPDCRSLAGCISAASSRKRRTCASRSSRRCSSRSGSAAAWSSALVSRTAPGIGAVSAAARSATVVVELGRPARRSAPARCAPPPRPRPSGRSRRSPAPARSQRASTSGFVPVRSGTSPSADSFMQNWASSATTRRSQRERELEAGTDGVPLHGRDRDEPRVAQPGEAAAGSRRSSPTISSSVSVQQPRDGLHALGRPAGSSIAAVEPGARSCCPLPRPPRPAYVVGQLLADRRQRPPHRRRLRVAHLGPVEGDRRDRRRRCSRRSPAAARRLGSHASESRCAGRARDVGSGQRRPGRRSRRSRGPRRRRAGSAPGRARARGRRPRRG